MKYKPSLHIEVPDISEGDKILYEKEFDCEVESYSITPTTFRSRTIKEIMKANFLEEEIATYDHKLHTLKEQGKMLETAYSTIVEGTSAENKLQGSLADVKKARLATEQNSFSKISQAKGYKEMLEKFSEFLSTPRLPLIYQDEFMYDSNSVTRYGINTINMSIEQVDVLVGIQAPIKLIELDSQSKKSGSGKSSNKEETIKELHPLEVFLIREAINSLKDGSNKTVLVDIFARENDNTIKIQETNKPETHTVVIYQNNARELIAINPNNSEFSKHLSSNAVKIVADGTKIITPTKQLKIYSPAGSVGPDINQYRDCIDIAVKIALGLNKLGVDRTLNISSLVDLELIQEITNNIDLNSVMTNSIDTPVRIRQASSNEIRENVNRIFARIEQQLKSIHAYHNTNNLEKLIYTEYTEKLKSNYNYDDLIKELVYYSGVIAYRFAAHIMDQADEIISFKLQLAGQDNTNNMET